MSTLARWRSNHLVLGVAALAYFSVRFVEYVLSIVFADVKTALGVSTFVVGLAVAGSTLTYALAQLPSGVLGDRFGHRQVVLAAVVLTGLASLLLAASPSGLGIVAGMALVGLVSGAYYSPATAMLTDRFDEFGTAIGVHRVGAQVVGFTGPVVALVVATYDWRAALVLAGAVTVPAFAGLALAVAPRPPADPSATLRGRVTPSTVRALLSRPPVAVTTVVAGFAQFADTATFSFLPLLLREYHGLAVEVTGVLFALYFAAVAVGQPLAGRLSDRLGRDGVTVGVLLLAVAGYGLLAAGRSLAVVAAAVGLVGLGMGWGPPVQARFVDHLGADERGTGFGLVRSTYIAFAALNGVVVGGVVTAFGWPAGIAVVTLALAVPVAVLAVRFGTGRAT